MKTFKIRKVRKLFSFRYLKWYISFIIIVGLGVALGLYKFNKNKPLCDKCNVILVSLDTLSALHLPCYGYDKNTAPNLCAYANKNVFFLNSYSNAPITLDSHFSIFTSLYPKSHKMTQVLGSPLEEKDLTLAQIFRRGGYQTIYDGPNGVQMPLELGIGRGFNSVYLREKSTDKWSVTYPELLRNAEKNKPVFLFLHTYAVHAPFITGHKTKHLFTDIPEFPDIPLTEEEYKKITPEFINFITDFVLQDPNRPSSSYQKVFGVIPEKYTKLAELNILLKEQVKQSDEVKVIKKLKQTNDLKEAKKIFSTLSIETQEFSFSLWYTYDYIIHFKDNGLQRVQYLKALYDEQIYNLDNQLKELFKLMEDPRLSKNTILIITADHGEEFLEHGNMYHGSDLYRTQTQVPLIMHIPGVSSIKVRELAQGIDIYPTALAITNLQPKSPIEGIDLTELIKGNLKHPTNKYIKSEFLGTTALQSGNWRLYYDDQKHRATELYNLTSDPVEQHNVISSYPEKVKEILIFRKQK